jgi:hypothetical protein
MKRIPRLLLTLALVLCASSVYAQGAREFIINHFVSDPNEVRSYLVITDVDGQGPTVSIKFYNNDGGLLGEGTELLPKFGKLNLDPGKYVGNKVVNGTIHIASTGGNIVAEYWQFYKKTNREWENTSSIGFAAPGYSRLVCPHFVSDKGTVEAYLVLANSDGKDVTADIKFYGDDGRELGSTRELVRANGKLILEPSKFVAKATGVAHIEAGGGRLTGEYWQKEAGKSYQRVVPMGGL